LAQSPRDFRSVAGRFSDQQAKDLLLVELKYLILTVAKKIIHFLSMTDFLGPLRVIEATLNKNMMKSGYMYILLCADGTYYTGSTTDMELRLQQHQNGEGANFTSKRLPVELLYFEFFQNVAEAFYREKQVQGWSRKKKEALMSGFSTELRKLAECMNETHCKNR